MIFPKMSLGEPRYSRCLTDKILAAFIQAYTLGQIDLADRLMDTLYLCGEVDGIDHGGEALEHAKLWVRFVQARDRQSDEAHDDEAMDAFISACAVRRPK